MMQRWLKNVVSSLASNACNARMGKMMEKNECEALNWRWFMAVDFKGKWTTISGVAHLDIGPEKISGFMSLQQKLEDNTDIYAELSANLNDDGSIDMMIVSPDEGVPSFQVPGSFYTLEGKDSSAHTLVLTDGTTVVGFTRHSAN